ncbi:hypothetical protein ACHAW5_010368 [Stephanodiscus triporus]|uniref:Uncharacterized protein n=1 Tax=Stephanodiscus triporus TaxID=2934178 RepID=A0ABD3N8L3_9STRA
MHSFDVLALKAVSKLRHFNSQGLSNMLWAYANRFQSTIFFNISWAYATAGESHPQLFKKFTDHIVDLESLTDFRPQALSNITLHMPMLASHTHGFSRNSLVISSHLNTLELVHATGSIHHHLGVYNCRRIIPMAFCEVCQSYNCYG